MNRSLQRPCLLLPPSSQARLGVGWRGIGAVNDARRLVSPPLQPQGLGTKVPPAQLSAASPVAARHLSLSSASTTASNLYTKAGYHTDRTAEVSSSSSPPPSETGDVGTLLASGRIDDAVEACIEVMLIDSASQANGQEVADMAAAFGCSSPSSASFAPTAIGAVSDDPAASTEALKKMRIKGSLISAAISIHSVMTSAVKGGHSASLSFLRDASAVRSLLQSCIESGLWEAAVRLTFVYAAYSSIGTPLVPPLRTIAAPSARKRRDKAKQEAAAVAMTGTTGNEECPSFQQRMLSNEAFLALADFSKAASEAPRFRIPLVVSRKLKEAVETQGKRVDAFLTGSNESAASPDQTSTGDEFVTLHFDSPLESADWLVRALPRLGLAPFPAAKERHPSSSSKTDAAASSSLRNSDDEGFTPTHYHSTEIVAPLLLAHLERGTKTTGGDDDNHHHYGSRSGLRRASSLLAAISHGSAGQQLVLMRQAGAVGGTDNEESSNTSWISVVAPSMASLLDVILQRLLPSSAAASSSAVPPCDVETACRLAKLVLEGATSCPGLASPLSTFPASSATVAGANSTAALVTLRRVPHSLRAPLSPSLLFSLMKTFSAAGHPELACQLFKQGYLPFLLADAGTRSSSSSASTSSSLPTSVSIAVAEGNPFLPFETLRAHTNASAFQKHFVASRPMKAGGEGQAEKAEQAEKGRSRALHLRLCTLAVRSYTSTLQQHQQRQQQKKPGSSVAEILSESDGGLQSRVSSEVSTLLRALEKQGCPLNEALTKAVANFMLVSAPPAPASTRSAQQQPVLQSEHGTPEAEPAVATPPPSPSASLSSSATSTMAILHAVSRLAAAGEPVSPATMTAALRSLLREIEDQKQQGAQQQQQQQQQQQPHSNSHPLDAEDVDETTKAKLFLQYTLAEMALVTPSVSSSSKARDDEAASSKSPTPQHSLKLLSSLSYGMMSSAGWVRLEAAEGKEVNLAWSGYLQAVKVELEKQGRKPNKGSLEWLAELKAITRAQSEGTAVGATGEFWLPREVAAFAPSLDKKKFASGGSPAVLPFDGLSLAYVARALLTLRSLGNTSGAALAADALNAQSAVRTLLLHYLLEAQGLALKTAAEAEEEARATQSTLRLPPPPPGFKSGYGNEQKREVLPGDENVWFVPPRSSSASASATNNSEAVTARAIPILRTVPLQRVLSSVIDAAAQACGDESALACCSHLLLRRDPDPDAAAGAGAAKEEGANGGHLLDGWAPLLLTAPACKMDVGSYLMFVRLCARQVVAGPASASRALHATLELHRLLMQHQHHHQNQNQHEEAQHEGQGGVKQARLNNNLIWSEAAFAASAGVLYAFLPQALAGSYRQHSSNNINAGEDASLLEPTGAEGPSNVARLVPIDAADDDAEKTTTPSPSPADLRALLPSASGALLLHMLRLGLAPGPRSAQALFGVMLAASSPSASQMPGNAEGSGGEVSTFSETNLGARLLHAASGTNGSSNNSYAGFASLPRQRLERSLRAAESTLRKLMSTCSEPNVARQMLPIPTTVEGNGTNGTPQLPHLLGGAAGGNAGARKSRPRRHGAQPLFELAEALHAYHAAVARALGPLRLEHHDRRGLARKRMLALFEEELAKRGSVGGQQLGGGTIEPWASSKLLDGAASAKNSKNSFMAKRARGAGVGGAAGNGAALGLTISSGSDAGAASAARNASADAALGSDVVHRGLRGIDIELK